MKTPEVCANVMQGMTAVVDLGGLIRLAKELWMSKTTINC